MMDENLSVNDPSHILYLHPSDNPNNVLVSELLNGQNYSHWRKAMEIALIAKNKLGFVLGTCIKPDLDSPLANQWDRCDKMVISWLTHAVVYDIAQSILFSDSASAIWTQLEQRFGESDGTRIFRVQKDLCTIAQSDLSVSSYFTQIKKLWDDYNGMITIPRCKCGIKCESYVAIHKFIETQQLIQFLVGLNEDYKGPRGHILMMKPLPSIDQAYQLVLQEEKQRALGSSSNISHQSAAFNARSYGNDDLDKPVLTAVDHTALAAQQRIQGYNANYKNTYKPGAYNNGTLERKPLFCDHCKMTGHTIQRCYKLHSYPPGHKLHKGRRIAATAQTETNSYMASQGVQSQTVPSLTPEQYSQLMLLLSKHSEIPQDNTEDSSPACFLAGPHLGESSAPW